ncbi:MAG: AAA family ATPase, partial [Candidatus Heimdallarchaeota archaeon]|nr:AAA family ATPase [Candidatus Heimdallarchaeota archaeon]
MERIHRWLQNFGLTKSVVRIIEGEKQPGYFIEVANRKTKVHSNILDVGFGLNQLFPVIIQCFYAPKGSLILIEQPEAHLHPRAQAELADFLIDVVNYGNRVIVETHSEHLLLRLQTRLAENKITPEAINVLYFEQIASGTKISNIGMSKTGYFIEPIPKGFFEEGFKEALAHLSASHPRDAKTRPRVDQNESTD